MNSLALFMSLDPQATFEIDFSFAKHLHKADATPPVPTMKIFMLFYVIIIQLSIPLFASIRFTLFGRKDFLSDARAR